MRLNLMKLANLISSNLFSVSVAYLQCGSRVYTRWDKEMLVLHPILGTQSRDLKSRFKTSNGSRIKWDFGGSLMQKNATCVDRCAGERTQLKLPLTSRRFTRNATTRVYNTTRSLPVKVTWRQKKLNGFF